MNTIYGKCQSKVVELKGGILKAWQQRFSVGLLWGRLFCFDFGTDVDVGRTLL